MKPINNMSEGIPNDRQLQAEAGHQCGSRQSRKQKGTGSLVACAAPKGGKEKVRVRVRVMHLHGQACSRHTFTHLEAI